MADKQELVNSTTLCPLCPKNAPQEVVKGKRFCQLCLDTNMYFRNVFLSDEQGRAVLKRILYDLKVYAMDSESTPENMALKNYGGELILRLSGGRDEAIDSIVVALVENDRAMTKEEQ